MSEYPRPQHDLLDKIFFGGDELELSPRVVPFQDEFLSEADNLRRYVMTYATERALGNVICKYVSLAPLKDETVAGTERVSRTLAELFQAAHSIIEELKPKEAQEVFDVRAITVPITDTSPALIRYKQARRLGYLGEFLVATPIHYDPKRRLVERFRDSVDTTFAKIWPSAGDIVLKKVLSGEVKYTKYSPIAETDGRALFLEELIMPTRRNNRFRASR